MIKALIHTQPSTADSPLKFTWPEWRVIIRNVLHEVHHDNIVIISAGVAFFSMLAIFPFISACLSIYGYLADPTTVQSQLLGISGLMPGDAWVLLNDQIQAVANAPSDGIGLRIAAKLLLALWAAGAGIRAVMRAMNIAYGEKEKRSFVKFYALATSMTFSVTLFMWLSLAVIIGVPAIFMLLHLEGVAALFTQFLPWIILVSLFSLATIILYRIGPSRRAPKMRWILPGVVFSTVAWLIISTLFSEFVAEFGSYNATYGSISAVIVLLVWFWLTAFVTIVGAVLNAEMERITAVDTTRGPDRPQGKRGAAMADYKHF